MGQTTDQIASGIDQTREELKSNLEELESRMKSAADWRNLFRKHPGPMVVTALLGGVILSSMFGKRSSTRQD